MIGFTTVRIVGPSMEPTLRNGEVHVVRRGARVRVGDVVVVRHPRRPELLTVKRIVRGETQGWWVEGDNPEHSSDSREFGPVSVDSIVGVLMFRVRPLRRA